MGIFDTVRNFLKGGGQEITWHFLIEWVQDMAGFILEGEIKEEKDLFEKEAPGLLQHLQFMKEDDKRKGAQYAAKKILAMYAQRNREVKDWSSPTHPLVEDQFVLFLCKMHREARKTVQEEEDPTTPPSHLAQRIKERQEDTLIEIAKGIPEEGLDLDEQPTFQEMQEFVERVYGLVWLKEAGYIGQKTFMSFGNLMEQVGNSAGSWSNQKLRERVIGYQQSKNNNNPEQYLLPGDNGDNNNNSSGNDTSSSGDGKRAMSDAWEQTKGGASEIGKAISVFLGEISRQPGNRMQNADESNWAFIGRMIRNALLGFAITLVTYFGASIYGAPDLAIIILFVGTTISVLIALWRSLAVLGPIDLVRWLFGLPSITIGVLSVFLVVATLVGFAGVTLGGWLPVGMAFFAFLGIAVYAFAQYFGNSLPIPYFGLIVSVLVLVTIGAALINQHEEMQKDSYSFSDMQTHMDIALDMSNSDLDRKKAAQNALLAAVDAKDPKAIQQVRNRLCNEFGIIDEHGNMRRPNELTRACWGLEKSNRRDVRNQLDSMIPDETPPEQHTNRRTNKEAVFIEIPADDWTEMFPVQYSNFSCYLADAPNEKEGDNVEMHYVEYYSQEWHENGIKEQGTMTLKEWNMMPEDEALNVHEIMFRSTNDQSYRLACTKRSAG